MTIFALHKAMLIFIFHEAMPISQVIIFPWDETKKEKERKREIYKISFFCARARSKYYSEFFFFIKKGTGKILKKVHGTTMGQR